MVRSLVIGLTLTACTTGTDGLSPDVFGTVQQPSDDAPAGNNGADADNGAEQNNDGQQDNLSDDNRSVLQFAPESNIWWDAHTLAIAPNARQAIMGMYYGDGTCWYDPESGYLGDEANYTDCDDDVLLFSASGSLLTAGWDCDELKLINVGPDETYNIPGLLTATFAGDDVVAVSGDPVAGACTLSRFAAEGSSSKTALPIAFCETSPELVGDTERVLLVAGGQLWHLAGDQTAVIADDVRTANVDRNTGNLMVVSQSAPDHVRALQPNGTTMWESTLTGPVDSIQALGDRGGWMMHVLGSGDAPGTMLAVSAADGATWAEGVAWPGVTDWEVSHDGGLLAVAVGNRVVYQYRILDNE
jgi:hypothetical protein